MHEASRLKKSEQVTGPVAQVHVTAANWGGEGGCEVAQVCPQEQEKEGKGERRIDGDW